MRWGAGRDPLAGRLLVELPPILIIKKMLVLDIFSQQIMILARQRTITSITEYSLMFRLPYLFQPNSLSNFDMFKLKLTFSDISIPFHFDRYHPAR